MKSVLHFQQRKATQQPISMVTCYDYTSARILDQTHVDCVLVGDSGGMVMLGKSDTTQTTLDDMAFMTRAVANGITQKFIISDLPFMTYRRALSHTMDAVTTLIQAGAHAIKLEGAAGNLDIINHIVESGVPVMGHLGLTPQFVHGLGGFKVQGKSKEAAKQLQQDAKQLEKAGCFAIVLECVPGEIATEITRTLNIPTIGIGAGNGTDGQVLVWQDLLALQHDIKPKFVKSYTNGHAEFTQALNQFVDDVQARTFPSEQHTYVASNT